MSVSRKALIEWLESEFDNGDDSYRAGIKWVAYQLEKGKFPSSESVGEADLSEIDESLEAAEYNHDWRAWVTVIRVNSLKALQISHNRLEKRMEKSHLQALSNAVKLDEARDEIAEADAWCEYWRREALRQHPTQWAYEQACKAIEKHRTENERLRAALSSIANDGINGVPSHIYKSVARKALEGSTSETAVQSDKADKVRQMYEGWNNMDEPAIYSSETIANIIADIALIVGIDIPGIDPDAPENQFPGIKDGREETE